MSARWVKVGMVLAVSTALSAAVPLAQGQGKGKKPSPEPVSEIPGEAILGCAGPVGPSTDGLCGDGSASYVDDRLPGGDMGVTVDLGPQNNNLRIRFYLGGGSDRFMTLFFPAPEPLESWECSDGDCLSGLDGARIAGRVDLKEMFGEGGTIGVIPKDANGDTLEGGFMSIPPGEEADANFNVGLADPYGRDYRWGLFWAPQNYSQTTPVQVSRSLDGCSWTVDATSGDVAGLRIHGATGKKKMDRWEGRFSMPFTLDFIAQGCPQ